MDKIKGFLAKISSGKGIYIAVGVTLLVAVGALAFIYNSSMNMLRDLTVPKVTVTSESPARQNITDEADPRYTQRAEKTTQTTSAATTTKAITTTQAPTAEKSTTNRTQPSAADSSFLYPVTGEIIKEYTVSPAYDETMEDYRLHRGIDFFCEKGEEIVSVGDGEVVKVTSDIAKGYCLEIDYGSFIGRYCGLQQGTTLKIGDKVKKGETVGKLEGMPAEAKQQSHLHFETFIGDEYIDPLKVLKEK